MVRIRGPAGSLLLTLTAAATLAGAPFPVPSSRLSAVRGQQPAVRGSPAIAERTSLPQPAAAEATARARCATCHPLPPPDVLPRSRWRDEIARMYLITTRQPEPSGPPGTAARMVRLPADWLSVVAYYEARAAERLSLPETWPAPDPTVRFERRVLPGPQPPFPAVANLRLIDVDRDGRLEVVLSDMRSGSVYTVRPVAGELSVREIARLSNPAHLAPVDLDGDGVLDFVVADLGSFAPADHDRGAVHWLRGRKDGTYLTVTLTRGPRVSDVEAADFDADGRLDLVVAAFGWRRTGSVTILKNETVDYESPSFVPRLLDARTGAIHAAPVDLNGDRRPDVVVLFAQEHERVVAYINRGDLQFEPRVVHAAPHPNWGSSGIELVDLDKDGDTDVLMTNGDTFDDSLAKPYHGIHWLENRGTFPFTEHRLATLAGVLRAQAADLDGDGDLDVVACALMPAAGIDGDRLPALVWLEQTRPGVFERHRLETGAPAHATLDTGDLDNDGDVDIVVGHFRLDVPVSGLMSILENARLRK